MISHQHRCIFIHIPKCAGTSFEAVLGHLDEYTGRAGQDHRSLRMIQSPIPFTKVTSSADNLKDLVRRCREPFRQHANQKNAYRVTPQQYQTYFKFTVVRNPWLRLHSWYRNVMRDKWHQMNYSIPNDISFEDFVLQYAGTGFLKPQIYWIKNFNGDVDLDYIGKFEQLDESFSYISNKLALKQATLPHRLPSNEADFYDDFTPKVVDYIAKYYAEEIEMFAYTF